MTEARLQVQDAMGRRLVVLDKPIFTLGRRSSSDLPLVDTEVSREHAEIALVDGNYVVRDRGSRYGTFVNGTAITGDHRLAHGDRIRLGRVGGAEVRFLIDDDTAGSGDASSSIAGGLRELAALLQNLQALGGARLVDDVLTLVMDAAIELTGAERGFVLLADAAGHLDLKLARARGKVSLSGASFDRSHKIPEDVFASGEERLVADLRDAATAGDHQGTLALGIRHLLCVPLKIVRYIDGPGQTGDTRAIGVLYLDSREKGTLLSRTARTALQALAAEAAVAIENARLYRAALEKARIEEELRVASQIQQALLPPPHREGAFVDAYGNSVACRTIGGDFFDYIDLPQGRFGVALGDVAGKGTPAALLTAVLQGMLTAQAQTSSGPADTMGRVNRGLLARAVEARFATAFFGILDADGTFTYCNAGHNPPFVFSKNGMRRLETGGLVVGLFAHATYEEERVRLEPGDVIVIFSDGVSEALNVEGEEFGDQRIVEAVTPVLSAAPQEILQALLSAVKSFCGAAPQNDDITGLVVRYQPSKDR